MMTQMRNKKAISDIVVTVLLVLTAIIVGTLIFAFGRSFISNSDGGETISKEVCAQKFNFQFSGCYNTVDNLINIDIVNFKQDIPAGSLISLDNGRSRVLTLLYQERKTLFQGQASSIILNASLVRIDLTTFDLKKIAIVPVLRNNASTVLCDNIAAIDVTKCEAKI
jgi:hypothetical protein